MWTRFGVPRICCLLCFFGVRLHLSVVLHCVFVVSQCLDRLFENLEFSLCFGFHLRVLCPSDGFLVRWRFRAFAAVAFEAVRCCFLQKLPSVFFATSATSTVVVIGLAADDAIPLVLLVPLLRLPAVVPNHCFCPKTATMGIRRARRYTTVTLEGSRDCTKLESEPTREKVENRTHTLSALFVSISVFCWCVFLSYLIRPFSLSHSFFHCLSMYFPSHLSSALSRPSITLFVLKMFLLFSSVSTLQSLFCLVSSRFVPPCPSLAHPVLSICLCFVSSGVFSLGVVVCLLDISLSGVLIVCSMSTDMLAFLLVECVYRTQCVL